MFQPSGVVLFQPKVGHFDVAVIGAGSGGLTAARTAASRPHLRVSRALGTSGLQVYQKLGFRV